MNQEKVSQCQYCFEGKCYANAAVSPEEYDAHQPKCSSNCQAAQLKKS